MWLWYVNTKLDNYLKVRPFISNWTTGTIKRSDITDEGVSVKNQHGESLGDLIGERAAFEGTGFPAHLEEIRNEDVIELFEEVNTHER